MKKVTIYLISCRSGFTGRVRFGDSNFTTWYCDELGRSREKALVHHLSWYGTASAVVYQTVPESLEELIMSGFYHGGHLVDLAGEPLPIDLMAAEFDEVRKEAETENFLRQLKAAEESVASARTTFENRVSDLETLRSQAGLVP